MKTLLDPTPRTKLALLYLTVNSRVFTHKVAKKNTHKTGISSEFEPGIPDPGNPFKDTHTTDR